MSDDKTKTAPQDAQRINIDEDYEVKYWTEKFGRSIAHLAEAVRKVGPMARDVERQLKRRSS